MYDTYIGANVNAEDSNTRAVYDAITEALDIPQGVYHDISESPGWIPPWRSAPDAAPQVKSSKEYDNG